VQINPPFGYAEIVPLYKSQKVRLPASGALPEFCRAVNAVPISYSEFGLACRDYPLAFITTDQGKTFTPVAVLGVAGAENLFLRDGRWDDSFYVPAYVRRYYAHLISLENFSRLLQRKNASTTAARSS
jgi:SapC protein